MLHRWASVAQANNRGFTQTGTAMRHVFLAAPLLLLAFAGPSLAQSVGPYVSGHVGVLGGDGGAAVAAGGAVGFMTTRRIGFELELSAWPGLDFGDLGFSRELPPFPAFIPAPTLDAKGRVLTFETNVVADVGSAGKVRLFVVAGGGVANVRRDIHYRYPDFIFPPEFVLPPDLDLPPGFTLPPPRLEFLILERQISSSESALCLNAGGIVEYAFSSQLSLGVDARYSHAFANRGGMDNARVTVRVGWQFR